MLWPSIHKAFGLAARKAGIHYLDFNRLVGKEVCSWSLP